MYYTYRYKFTGNIVLLESIPDESAYAKKLRYIHITESGFIPVCNGGEVYIGNPNNGHIIHRSNCIDDLIAQTMYDML